MGIGEELSPSTKELSDLKLKWKSEAEKAGLSPDKRLEDKEDLDMSPSGLEALGGAVLPDIDNLSESTFEPDTSLTNGSSIALLAEYDGKIILFAGDAMPQYFLTLSKRIFRIVNLFILIFLKCPIMEVTVISQKSYWNGYDAVTI